MRQLVKDETTFKSINPATGEFMQHFPEFTPEEVERKLAQADDAHRFWRKQPLADRAQLLQNIADLMLQHQAELAKLETLEMGKPLKQSMGEVAIAAGIFSFYAKNGERLLADKPVETEEDGTTFLAYEPIGVVLSIQPWNFPYYQIARSTAPNLIAGNTVVLKHAEIVPQLAHRFEELVREAGASEGIYTNLFAQTAHMEEIIADNRIKAVTLTGSERAGSQVAATASKHIKKTVLELGGSDPFIVLEDADLDAAVERAVLGRLSNAGQVCTSPKRIIVVASIAEEFKQKALEKLRSIKVGDPLDEAVDMGPLSSKKALDGVLAQVQKAAEQGANVLAGGRQIEGPGYFMEPTFMDDITPEMDAYSEEIFGPVFMFYVVQDEAAAIAMANDTRYGLGASVFTKDESRGIRVARQIAAGMVYVNHETSNSPELPFGGTKNSGFGREQGELGIYEFLNIKLIRVTTPDKPY